MDEQTGEDVAPELFTSVRSLAQLAQVSEEVLQGIQHWFTADSEHEGVNLNFAESGLVFALAPDEAEALLATRNEDDSPTLDGMGNIFMQQEQGDSVRVQVELSSSASKRKIEATVAFNDGEQGYHVVRWNEYNAYFSLE